MSVSFVLAESAVTHVLFQSSDADPYVLTTARFWATSAALLGLAGAVVGGTAFARSVRRNGEGGRRWAGVALLTGLIAVVGGAVNLAVADGGPGTGNGVVGGAAALMMGLIAMFLGGRALARSRRNAAPVDGRPTG